MEEILNILPNKIKEAIEKLKKLQDITEIRLRNLRPIIVYISDTEHVLNYIVTKQDFMYILGVISKNSIYAIEKDLKQGFVPIKGGHRIGVCGEIVFENDEVVSIKNINSMNIRIARQKIGVARKIMPYIIENGEIKNTLIVSPPGMGKTTLLRDITRYISDGVYELGFSGVNVGVVDERSEIASSSFGDIILDVGMRTDVISNVPKAKGIEMIVRSMASKIIVTDEIGLGKDIRAIRYAVTSGVKCIFTAHGKNLQDIMMKGSEDEFDNIASLIKEGIFDNVIVLSNSRGIGTVEHIHKIGKRSGYEEVV